jgi:hypothetical protein
VKRDREAAESLNRHHIRAVGKKQCKAFHQRRLNDQHVDYVEPFYFTRVDDAGAIPPEVVERITESNE